MSLTSSSILPTLQNRLLMKISKELKKKNTCSDRPRQAGSQAGSRGLSSWSCSCHLYCHRRHEQTKKGQRKFLAYKKKEKKKEKKKNFFKQSRGFDLEPPAVSVTSEGKDSLLLNNFSHTHTHSLSLSLVVFSE